MENSFKNNLPKFLLLVLVIGLFLILWFTINQDERNFINNSVIYWGVGWIDDESRYAGSELSFAFNGSNQIGFTVETNSKATQGLNIIIDKQSYTLSSPNLNTQKLTINVNKNSSHSVTVRYFCTHFSFPCQIKIKGIYLNPTAQLTPFQSHFKILSVLGDSISTIYGQYNYTRLLADTIGYELHNASVVESTVSPVKGIDNAIFRYKNDLLSFKSDLIIIFLGTNDAGNNVPLSEFEKNYSKIVSDVKEYNPHANIFLVSAFPRKDLDSTILNSYNSIIKNVSEKYGEKFIDTSSWLDEYDYSDPIHPSSESQGKISQDFQQEITPYLNKN